MIDKEATSSYMIQLLKTERSKIEIFISRKKKRKNPVLLISQLHCFQYQLFKTKQSKISQVMPEKNSLMEHYPVYKPTLIFFLNV